MLCNFLFKSSAFFLFLQVSWKRIPESKSSVERANEDSSFSCEIIFHFYLIFAPKIFIFTVSILKFLTFVLCEYLIFARFLLCLNLRLSMLYFS